MKRTWFWAIVTIAAIGVNTYIFQHRHRSFIRDLGERFQARPPRHLSEQDLREASRPIDLNSTNELPLRPEAVTRLEQEWSRLPQQAEAVVDSRGWRLIRIEENSAFAQLGFKVGDVIPNKSIDDRLADFGGPENSMAKRIVKLLNHITK